MYSIKKIRHNIDYTSPKTFQSHKLMYEKSNNIVHVLTNSFHADSRVTAQSFSESHLQHVYTFFKP